MNKEKTRILKDKVIHEFKLFWMYFTFFLLFFYAFNLYQRLILKEYAIDYMHYGYNFFEAMILSKIILIGQSFNLGSRFNNKPLIIPTFYMSVVFSFFVLVLTIFEHFFVGYVHGKTFTVSYQEMLNTDIYQILSKLLVMFFVFILFFAFIQLDRVMGKNKLFNLFMKGEH